MGASERDEWLRATWRVLVAGAESGIDAERLVFVDEMGANTSLAPLHAWSRRGERARCSVPRNRGKSTTLLASMSSEGMGPCLAVAGGTTEEVFEAYVERVLAPTLQPGHVVVVDNLSAHKGEEVRESIEARGCELLFLPPYSPDMNPIEEAFSKIKGLLRKAEARTREALIKAMGARYRRSRPVTLGTSWGTAATGQRVGCYDGSFTELRLHRLAAWTGPAISRPQRPAGGRVPRRCTPAPRR